MLRFALAAIVLLAYVLYSAIHHPKQYAPLYTVGRAVVFPIVQAWFLFRNLWIDTSPYAVRALPILQNVYLSLSSTPGRIKTLHHTLANLAGQVQEVHLNLPRLFRNTTAYNESELLVLQHRFPNLRIFRFEDDIGPGMKIVPTLERLHAPDSDAIVVSIDDDVLLPTDCVAKFAALARTTRNVVTQWDYGSSVDGVRYKSVFGNRGVAYPVAVCTPAVTQSMRAILKTKECKLHDDMGLSMALHKHKISIQNIDFPVEGENLAHGFTNESISYTSIVDFRDRDVLCIQAALQLQS